MKKLIAVCAAMMMVIPVFAQVKWENCTFQQALDKAKNENKLVFLDCYTSWCGPCKMMIRDIFPTKEAGDYFNAKFVNIKMDMEKGEGPELCKKYMVNGFPTFLVLDSNGNEVGKTTGSNRNVASFIKVIEGISDIKDSPVGLLEKYNRTHEVNDALSYLNKVDQAKMTNRVVDFFVNNYDRLPYWSRSYDRMWVYLQAVVSVKYPKILDDVLANRHEFNKWLGKGAVDAVLEQRMIQDIEAFLRGTLDLTAAEARRAADIYAMVEHGNDPYHHLLCTLAVAHAAKDVEQLESILSNKYEVIKWVNPDNFESFFCYIFDMEEVSDQTKREIYAEYVGMVDFYKKRMSGFYPQYTGK